MKKFSFLTLLLSLCITTFAESNNQMAVLPLEFNTGNLAPKGLPSTIVYIQGQKIPVIFDTGAGKSEIALSSYALRNINIKFTGKKICFKTITGKVCEKEFILPEVILGNIKIKNVHGTLMKELWGNANQKSFKQTEASKSGVIGIKLLSQFDFLLDYKNSRVIIEQSGEIANKYNVENWLSIPFTKPLNTHLHINKQNFNILWDTGCAPSIIKESLVAYFPQKTCPSYQSDCLSVDLKLLTPDGKQLPETWFKITKTPKYAPFDGIMGSNFYRENLVYFDFTHNKIYVKPY